MKKCPRCGAEIPDGAGSCPKCGHAVEEQKLSSNLEKIVAESTGSTPRRGRGGQGKKKSVLLLISWVLGLFYAGYLIAHFGGGITGAGSDGELLGAAIATTIVGPHMICVIVAVIFNLIGWARSARWAALTGAILYAVSMVLFPMYFMFTLIQTVLSFVGFAKLKKGTESVE